MKPTDSRILAKQMLKSPEREPGDTLLTELAWRRLRDDIVAGALAPDTRLRISRLRTAYGIGASPIREALSRLVANNFVLSVERRGFVVAPVSLAEFRDLTDVRKILERQALSLSLAHGDGMWESEVIAAFHRLGKAHERMDPADPATLEAFEDANRVFHEALVAACPSRWLLQFRRTAYELAERYRRICQTIQSVSRDVHKEHAQLRNAAIDRDAQKIHAIIDQHLERTYQKVARSGRLAEPGSKEKAAHAPHT